MQATSSHKIRKSAGILILAAIFMSILASVSLPSILGFNEAHREQASLTLPEKDMKECYDSSDPENEALEEIDLYQEQLAPTAMPERNSSGCLFSFLITHLSTTDSDIQIPPPEFIAA